MDTCRQWMFYGMTMMLVAYLAGEGLGDWATPAATLVLAMGAGARIDRAAAGEGAS